MSIKKRIYALISTGFYLPLLESVSIAADAQDPLTATNDFSTQMITIFKGPIVKVLAGIILFVGVGGLLRGRYPVAVSCGIAFVLLLFLPIILQYFGG